MGLRTLTLAVVSAAGFSGVVYATFALFPGLGGQQWRALSLPEADNAGRYWQNGHVQLHLGEERRYSLSFSHGVADEDGSLETGYWRFETPDRMTLQPDGGELRRGTIEGSVLHMDAVGSMVEIQLGPICHYGDY